MTWKKLPRIKLSQRPSGWRGGNGPALMLVHGVGMRTDLMSQAMAALVPDATCCIVDNARHMMSMTHASVITDAIVSVFGDEEKSRASA